MELTILKQTIEFGHNERMKEKQGVLSDLIFPERLVLPSTLISDGRRCGCFKDELIFLPRTPFFLVSAAALLVRLTLRITKGHL